MLEVLCSITWPATSPNRALPRDQSKTLWIMMTLTENPLAFWSCSAGVLPKQWHAAKQRNLLLLFRQDL